MRVSILIPTFRRPQSFLRAARSAMAQNGVGDFEIVAVDNSPEGSALQACRELADHSAVPFRWAHAGKPGVANARNTAIALARGNLVAWLDDDQEAPADWLAALVAVRRETGVQSVFGPVMARAPANATNVRYFEALYTRTGPARSGLSAKSYGIGNSLQPRAMFNEAQPFDPHANETGGEDDALFASWAEAGARFAWAADAGVIEHLDPQRLSLAHGLKRAFAYGQGPSETAWSQRKVLTLGRHMTIGAAQAAAYTLAGAVCSVAAPQHTLNMADRAARGAGKVFWFYTQRFYGETLARQPA